MLAGGRQKINRKPQFYGCIRRRSVQLRAKQLAWTRRG
jgi:hypothetical protein